METREETAAKSLMDSVNSTTFDTQKFAEAVCRNHRTLQQSYFRTIVAVIQMMASPDYGYDLRNEASHLMAQRIVESGALEETSLPFI